MRSSYRPRSTEPLDALNKAAVVGDALAAQLSAAGEVVIFDGSWQDHAGVEGAMSYCVDDQVKMFLPVRLRRFQIDDT